MQLVHLSDSLELVELALEDCSFAAWSPNATRVALECAGAIHVAAVDDGSSDAETVEQGHVLGWISDELLALKTNDGALSAVHFRAGRVELNALESATSIATLQRTDSDSERALFADDSATSFTFVDFRAGVLTSGYAKDAYAARLDYLARFVPEDSASRVEIVDASRPDGVPIAVIPASTLLGWSEDGTTIVTQSLDDTHSVFTRIAPFRSQPASFRTDEVVGWGLDDRWAIVNSGFDKVLLNLVPDEIDEMPIQGTTVVAPSRDRFYVTAGTVYYRPCAMIMSDAGPSAPVCLGSSSGIEWWDPLWSADSSVIVSREYMSNPAGFWSEAVGLVVLDVRSGAELELVRPFEGISVIYYVDDLRLQP